MLESNYHIKKKTTLVPDNESVHIQSWVQAMAQLVNCTCYNVQRPCSPPAGGQLGKR